MLDRGDGRMLATDLWISQDIVVDAEAGLSSSAEPQAGEEDDV